MIECMHPAERPILVATSAVFDAELARSAIEELGLVPVLLKEAAEALRLLCVNPKRFAAVVAGEWIGRTSGLTLCGVARDAGCRLPMLLLTSDDCRWTAVRAARLQVGVLWQPSPAWRIAQSLIAMLPRGPCGAARPSGFRRGPRPSPGPTPPGPRPASQSGRGVAAPGTRRHTR
jgi:hypothetical protein